MATFEGLVPDGGFEEEAAGSGEELDVDEPQVDGDIYEQDEENEGAFLELTYEDEVAARRTLGNLQPHVTDGIGPIGIDNALVIICVSTYGIPRSGKSEAQKPQLVVQEHFPGNSLHHILGCERLVSTAYHSLKGCMKDYGGPVRTLTFWAMLARNYITLDARSKEDLECLKEKGAIKVVKYYASAEDLAVDVSWHRGTHSLLLPLMT